ncbi:hypothetical protein C8R45DRAFT_942515 [Mycena sanguinolenta]|nr:hypothetical protein C8R45DRAFT_942515 [Mycena sanguinolenta]
MHQQVMWTQVGSTTDASKDGDGESGDSEEQRWTELDRVVHEHNKTTLLLYLCCYLPSCTGRFLQADCSTTVENAAGNREGRIQTRKEAEGMGKEHEENTMNLTRTKVQFARARKKLSLGYHFHYKTQMAVYIMPSASALACMLVSKTWCSVTIPIIYYTIFLESKAQAQILAAAVETELKPGRWICTLVVAGSFGDTMGIIYAVKLDIISLHLTLGSSNDVNGLIESLPLLNLRHLILYDIPQQTLLSD